MFKLLHRKVLARSGTRTVLDLIGEDNRLHLGSSRFFKIHPQLARGTFNSIHLVEFIYRGRSSKDDPNTATVAKINLLFPDATYHRRIHDHFLSEVELLKGLNHDNVVRYIHHFSFTASDSSGNESVPFTALFLTYHPHSLRDLILRILRNELTLTQSQFWRIFKGGFFALFYLFQQGMEHGDIKPANILLTENFTFKLADFGAAKSLDRDGSNPPFFHCTRTTRSPEVQLGGKSTCLSDLFSMGVSLVELLCLNHLFDYDPLQSEDTHTVNLLNFLGPPSVEWFQDIKTQYRAEASRTRREGLSTYRKYLPQSWRRVSAAIYSRPQSLLRADTISSKFSGQFPHYPTMLHIACGGNDQLKRLLLGILSGCLRYPPDRLNVWEVNLELLTYEITHHHLDTHPS